ncbi:MAG: hypothetical protein CUN49_15380 [Candidatus Thermofonsia Clade 1 bacterium]|uniref:Uncharacterized protein n=1 Tax=Candidatus Thermofonsia Clade 1 bacterium TaxID=2364210 RepID=A0A2M8PAB6_9CHLR|nr:MAG: hypothetical protein CUN49_15380 [Candidatus Thermofonsia Clade 1 bacterium]
MPLTSKTASPWATESPTTLVQRSAELPCGAAVCGSRVEVAVGSGVSVGVSVAVAVAVGVAVSVAVAVALGVAVFVAGGGTKGTAVPVGRGVAVSLGTTAMVFGSRRTRRVTRFTAINNVTAAMAQRLKALKMSKGRGRARSVIIRFSSGRSTALARSIARLSRLKHQHAGSALK